MALKQLSRTRRALAVASGIALVAVVTAVTPAEADRPGRAGGGTGEIVPLSADLVVGKETQHLYRDSKGRTRTEIGSTVTISDPTTGTTVVLDVASRTFQRSAGTDDKAPSSADRKAAGDEQITSKQRSLGTKTVSGVKAEGRQYTVTLPAHDGLPVRTKNVTLWLSAEAQLPVKTTVVDEDGAISTQTYTNIRTGTEPAASLFSVPAGYREAAPPAAASDGMPVTCPLNNDDPVILTSIDLIFLDSRNVNATTDPLAGCVFVADGGIFQYPLEGFPTVDLLLPFDQWFVFDNGGLLPFLPYVAFGDIAFVAANPLEAETTTKDSLITLTIFPAI